MCRAEGQQGVDVAEVGVDGLDAVVGVCQEVVEAVGDSAPQAVPLTQRQQQAVQHAVGGEGTLGGGHAPVGQQHRRRVHHVGQQLQPHLRVGRTARHLARAAAGCQLLQELVQVRQRALKVVRVEVDRQHGVDALPADGLVDASCKECDAHEVRLHLDVVQHLGNGVDGVAQGQAQHVGREGGAAVEAVQLPRGRGSLQHEGLTPVRHGCTRQPGAREVALQQGEPQLPVLAGHAEAPAALGQPHHILALQAAHHLQQHVAGQQTQQAHTATHHRGRQGLHEGRGGGGSCLRCCPCSHCSCHLVVHVADEGPLVPVAQLLQLLQHLHGDAA
mmetsp:Transcript_28124/g.61708  ORF Transcript_28124/g.61708 Transcript_28124/m.61708 type:complete len:331 (+) Transcript_28124:1982-2974(+)